MSRGVVVRVRLAMGLANAIHHPGADTTRAGDLLDHLQRLHEASPGDVGVALRILRAEGLAFLWRVQAGAIDARADEHLEWAAAMAGRCKTRDDMRGGLL